MVTISASPHVGCFGLPGAMGKGFWDNGEREDIEICFSSL